jgi:hypothetical protein
MPILKMKFYSIRQSASHVLCIFIAKHNVSDGAHQKDVLHLSLMILFQQDQFFNSDKAACLQSIEIYAA